MGPMAKKASKASADPGEDLDFDGKLERLEGLVRELEGPELGLEAAIARYAEGVDLLKSCHSALAGHRKRVEELSADAEASLASLRDDPDFSGDSAS